VGAAPGDLGVPLGDPLGRTPHHVETGVGGVEMALLGGELWVDVGTVGLGRRTRCHGVGQLTISGIAELVSLRPGHGGW
jgi:hypothetical protein